MKSLRRWRSLREIEARQRSTVWPDTLRNGAVVDAFLWKGSPNATPIQRIGTGLVGLLFLCPAVLLMRFGFFENGPTVFRGFMFLLAIPWVAISCKLLRNALRH
jgi:hypothetical protein